jgi:hypothetical protein
MKASKSDGAIIREKAPTRKPAAKNVKTSSFF